MELTVLQSRQYLIKAIVRCIAIVDLMHMIFPIILFCNFNLYAVLMLFGPKPKVEGSHRIFLVTTPIGIIGVIAFSYGLMVAVRLFRSTHPEIHPRKSASMAMWWFHYSILLVVMEEVASLIYFYIGEKEDTFFGEIFTFGTNFSVSVRVVCIFLVRKFIREMRKKDFQLTGTASDAVTQSPNASLSSEQRKSVKWDLPEPRLSVGSRRTSSISETENRQEYLLRQNLYQMMFITKLLLVVDLIQNTFAILTFIVQFISFVNSISKVKVAKDQHLQYYGVSTAGILYWTGMFVVFFFASYTGVKLLTSTDEFANTQLLEELSKPLQTRLIRAIRNWRFCCIAIIVSYETICLVLIIVYGTTKALVVTAGLSFSMSIRVASFYVVSHFKQNFFKKSNAGTGVRGSKVHMVPVRISSKPGNNAKIVPVKLVGTPLSTARETEESRITESTGPQKSSKTTKEEEEASATSSNNKDDKDDILFKLSF